MHSLHPSFLHVEILWATSFSSLFRNGGPLTLEFAPVLGIIYSCWICKESSFAYETSVTAEELFQRTLRLKPLMSTAGSLSLRDYSQWRIGTSADLSMGSSLSMTKNVCASHWELHTWVVDVESGCYNAKFWAARNLKILAHWVFLLESPEGQLASIPRTENGEKQIPHFFVEGRSRDVKEFYLIRAEHVGLNAHTGFIKDRMLPEYMQVKYCKLVFDVPEFFHS